MRTRSSNLRLTRTAVSEDPASNDRDLVTLETATDLLRDGSGVALVDILYPRHIPVADRVADRLGDLLLAADDLRDMLNEEGAESIRWMSARLLSIFDDANELMRHVSA